MKVSISNLIKQFGDKTAVNINEFCIESGDMLGLVGNNGAGKTTLFRLILDLLKADNGFVTISQDETTINPALSEDWKPFTGAYIDEGFLIDFLTPEEYFQFIGKVNGMNKEQVEERLKPFEQFMEGEVLGQKKLIRNLSAGNNRITDIDDSFLTGCNGSDFFWKSQIQGIPFLFFNHNILIRLAISEFGMACNALFKIL